MKRKLAGFIAALVAVFTFAFGFAACDEELCEGNYDFYILSYAGEKGIATHMGNAALLGGEASFSLYGLDDINGTYEINGDDLIINMDLGIDAFDSTVKFVKSDNMWKASAFKFSYGAATCPVALVKQGSTPRGYEIDER